MRMGGARAAAVAAAFGIVLQGLDSGSIAGALLFVNAEFRLDKRPRLQGFVVSSRMIAAGLTTAFAGRAADWLGRRRMLCASAVLFSISGCIMAWSPNVYVLLLGRMVVGTGIGFASTTVHAFIVESAPAEIRGQLSILPQLASTWGQFLAYCGSFGISLLQDPNWRLMLGLLCVPSIGYLFLCIFFLPESPRWLLCKGRVLEAERVLRQLRNRQDVSGEIALMIEGLDKGSSGAFEKYLVRPVDRVDDSKTASREGMSMTWTDRTSLTVEGPCGHSLCSQGGSASKDIPSLPRIDPLVTLVGSLQTNMEYHQESAEPAEEEKVKQWPDVENQEMLVNADGEMDDDLITPLLFRPNSGNFIFSKTENVDFLSPSKSEKIDFACESHPWMTPDTHVQRYGMSVLESLGCKGNIGGGRLVACSLGSDKGSDDVENSLKRPFVLQGNTEPPVATAVLPGEHVGSPDKPDVVPAAGLIQQPAQFAKDVLKPATAYPAETATISSAWSSLLEIGVRRALVVGLGIQFLQQFSGTTAVLYYAPQIMQQAGVDRLLPPNTSLTSESFSILASTFNSALMLPCIVVAMKLIDSMGRRLILLATIPVLIVSMFAIVLIKYLLPPGPTQACLSFISLVSFTCFWVSGFGPIPNILCSEIFPTRVRGLCIGLCSAALWICNVIVCETFPILLARIGLQGIFTFFGTMSVISWFFVFLKVPETKGFPLEVITEFFSISNRRPSE